MNVIGRASAACCLVQAFSSYWAKSFEVERLESIEFAVVDLVRNIFLKKKYSTIIPDFLPYRMLHSSSLRKQNPVAMRDDVPTLIRGVCVRQHFPCLLFYSTLNRSISNQNLQNYCRNQTLKILADLIVNCIPVSRLTTPLYPRTTVLDSRISLRAQLLYSFALQNQTQFNVSLDFY